MIRILLSVAILGLGLSLAACESPITTSQEKQWGNSDPEANEGSNRMSNPSNIYDENDANTASEEMK